MSDRPAILRLDHRMMKEVTIVIRVSKVPKVRLRLALWLMRAAARIGGFRGVTLARRK